MTAEPVRDDDRHYDQLGYDDPVRSRLGGRPPRSRAGRPVRTNRTGAGWDARREPAERYRGEASRLRGDRARDDRARGDRARGERGRDERARGERGRRGEERRAAGQRRGEVANPKGDTVNRKSDGRRAAAVRRADARTASGRPRRRTEGVSRGAGVETARRDRGTAARAERVSVVAETSSRRTAPPAAVPLPRTPFVLLVLGLVAAGIVGLLVLNTAINTSSLRVQQLRTQQSTLDDQEQQLNQQLADLESPGNLQAAATRMGLVPAGQTAFIRLPDGKVIGVPQPVSAHGSGQ